MDTHSHTHTYLSSKTHTMHYTPSHSKVNSYGQHNITVQYSARFARNSCIMFKFPYNWLPILCSVSLGNQLTYPHSTHIRNAC